MASRTRYRSRWLLLLAGWLASAGAAAQSVTWPSATPPCNGTLQACLDAQPPGFVVLIDSDAPTNVISPPATALVLSKSVFVFPAPGRKPRLPPGLSIVVQLLPAASEVLIEGLTLQAGAEVRIIGDHPSGRVTVGVRRMRFEHLGVAGGGVSVRQENGGELRIQVRDNDFLRTGGAGNFGFVHVLAGLVTGEIAFNRVAIPDGASSAYGIAALAVNTGRYDLTVASNEIQGSFAYGALCAVAGQSIATPPLPASTLRVLSNVVRPGIRGLGTGVCGYAGEAPITLTLANNTLIDLGQAIALIPRPFDPPASPAPISGQIANNLIAYNAVGVNLAAVASGVGNQHNLLFGNGSNGSGVFSPGTATVFANPLLTSRERPYLGAGSPAINAGNINHVPAPTVWPRLDADGLRRTIGSAPDIGAYEFGDAFFDVVATSANTAGNYLVLDHPSTNGQILARVLATRNFSLAGVGHTRPFGVWWIGAPQSRMSIFNQDNAAMAAGSGFNVFVPGSPTPVGAGPPRDGSVFVHRVGAPAAGSTMLDDSSVNLRPEQIVLVTQNWNPQDPPASSGIYNEREVTLEIYADERWRIASTDGGLLPVGAAFNVYAQPPSPNAFVQPAAPMSGSYIVLDHPWLNGNRCARPQVTSVFADASAYDLDYNAVTGRWRIFRSAPGSWPSGARFHVLVSPRQVFECAGPLFRDGFE
jgi:hypothetical protein